MVIRMALNYEVIYIKKDFKDFLDKLKSTGESYQDLIKRLIHYKNRADK